MPHSRASALVAQPNSVISQEQLEENCTLGTDPGVDPGGQKLRFQSLTLPIKSFKSRPGIGIAPFVLQMKTGLKA